MISNKLVIYTALFGDYDQLEEPEKSFEGCDFICFTDQKDLKTNIWRIIYIEPTSESHIFMNRKIKMLPHLYLQKWKYSLYVDSNIRMKENPYFLINKYMHKQGIGFLVSKHYLRNCVYHEAIQCMKLGKGDPEAIQIQMEVYKNSAFPTDWGLSENSIILRKHQDETVQKIGENWWLQFTKYPTRDQLSLPFSLWQKGHSYRFMEEGCREYFGIFAIGLHRKEEKNLNFLQKFLFQYVYSKKNPLSHYLLNR
jgi:hypothetical protein